MNQRLRSNLPYILTAAAVLLILALLMIISRSTRMSEVNARDAVPSNVAVIVETSDLSGLLNKLQSGNQLFEIIAERTRSTDLRSIIHTLDSLLKNNDQYSAFTRNTKACLSFHVLSGRKTGVLFAIPVGTSTNEKQFVEGILQKIDRKAAHQVRQYERVSIYELAADGARSGTKVSCCIDQGILLMSLNPDLIEDAVLNIKNPSRRLHDAGLKRVTATSGRHALANIFIYYPRLAEYLGILMPSETGLKTGFLRSLADWGALDLDLAPDRLILNGFTWPGESNRSYFSIYSQQSPQEIKVARILPSSTFAWLGIGIENFSDFHTEYYNYLKSQALDKSFLARIDEADSITNTRIEEIYASIISNEMGIFHCTLPGGSTTVAHFIKVRSTAYAADAFTGLINNYAERNEVNPSSFIQKAKLYADSTVNIYELPYLYLNRIILGPLFGNSESRFCAFCDNYLVFSDSREALTWILKQRMEQKTLVNDIAYNALSESIDKQSNITFYYAISKAPGFISKKQISGDSSNWLVDTSFINKFETLIYQSSNSNGLIYNNLQLCCKYEKESAGQVLWKAKLDAPVRGRPQFVTNHNTGIKEVLVQDTASNLYLFTGNGQRLWKLHLDGQAMGEFIQVDFFGNGKLQYLFNTSTQVHLIDRNGDEVSPFPWKIPTQATNSLSVFDYDNNHEFRVFLAGEGNAVYAFDKLGKPLAGWSFSHTEGMVSMPVNHFRINGKDYIVLTDNRSIYILNRKGEVRVKTDKNIALAANSAVLESVRGRERLAYTDTSGTVYLTYFNGKTEMRTIHPFSKKHYFDYQDVDADGLKDFIFADGRKLEVYRVDGTPVYQYTFPAEITSRPVYFNFAKNDRRLGIVTASDYRIYLIDNNGTVHPGYPLTGSTSFSIGNLVGGDGFFDLIVGRFDNFLYTYFVQ